MSEETLEKLVRDALREVEDPELRANLVDLGMIKKVRIREGVAEIDLRLTTPFCPLASFMVADVKEKVESVEGIEKAVVNLV